MKQNIRELFKLKREAYSRWKELMAAIGDKPKSQWTAEEAANVDKAEDAMDDANEKLLDAQEAERIASKVSAIGESLERAATLPPVHIQTDEPMAARPTFRSLCEQGLSRKDALKRIAEANDEQSQATGRAMDQWFSRGYIDPALRSKAALQMDKDTAGGYLVVPEQFVAKLIQDLDYEVFIRQYATIYTLTDAESLGAPALDTDIADTNWTTELAIGTVDSSLAFGKRRLTPHPLAKYILVSKDLLMTAAISVEAIVRQRLAYKFGTVQEAAFMTGSGSGQPLGLFTASANGITTSQDVSTGNTSTAFTADGLINCKYKLTSPYLRSPNLRWIFHRDGIKMARQLKTGDGQYLWKPGLAGDPTDTLLDVPVLTSEFAPNTFTTLLYTGLIGDLGQYYIADAMSMRIERLVELGAATNQDYFIGRLKCDGMPVLSTAFARVKLG